MADARALEALDVFATLLRTSRALATRADSRLVQAGLTPTQFGVLEAILHEGALSQHALSSRVATSAGNMTDLIDKLETRGLVHRARQKLDRRAVLVELTQEGREVIGPLLANRAADIVAAMANLSSDELHRLGELLRRLELVVAG